jgi:drug/metabolite transporter (DMT)-like permease
VNASRQPRWFLAAALVAAYALAWASVELTAGGTGVPLEQLVWMRYLVHVVALVLLFGWQRGWGIARTAQPVMHIVRSLLMLVMPLGFILAAERIGGRNTMTVFWIMPAIILALTRTTEVSRWLLAAVAYAGIVLIFYPSGFTLDIGLLFALAMAASLAAYAWMTEKLHDDIVVNLFQSAIWVLLALSIRMPMIWQWPTLTGWLAIIGVGIGGLVTLWLLDLAIRQGGARAVAYSVWLQPVFEVLMTARIGERRIALGASIICAVVVAGLFLHRERRESRAPFPAQAGA